MKRERSRTLEFLQPSNSPVDPGWIAFDTRLSIFPSFVLPYRQIYVQRRGVYLHVDVDFSHEFTCALSPVEALKERGWLRCWNERRMQYRASNGVRVENGLLNWVKHIGNGKVYLGGVSSMRFKCNLCLIRLRGVLALLI